MTYTGLQTRTGEASYASKMTDSTGLDPERDTTDAPSSPHQSAGSNSGVEDASEAEREESPVDDDNEDNELLTENGLPPLPEGGPASGPAPLP